MYLSPIFCYSDLNLHEEVHVLLVFQLTEYKIQDLTKYSLDN